MQSEARGHPSIGNTGAVPPTDGPLQPTTGQETGPAPLCQNKEALHKKSYIDDLTLLEKISLAKLRKKQRIVGPLNWHDRFNLTLSPNQFILQHQLDDLVQFTKEKSMKINSSKTKCLPFINSRTKDFEPKLSIEEGTHLEIIYMLKLVGLVITSSLTWHDHVDYTVKRVNGVIWQLVRFKNIGASRENYLLHTQDTINSNVWIGVFSFIPIIRTEP